MRLQGKKAIVTGGAAGIGRAIAEAFVREGAEVVLFDLHLDKARKTAAEVSKLGGKVHAVQCDVGFSDQVARAFREADEQLGGLDVLVNNAGLSMWARFEEITDLSLFERIMRVNYLGAVYCTHHALPHLKQRRGLLVAISSLTGKTGVPTRSAYAASKHAMQGFFDTLRIELRGRVDVLVVSPGFVATGVRERALGADGQPLRQSPRDEGRGTMSATECADRIAAAMERRDRELTMTAQGRVGLWLKLLAPGLVDRMAAHAVRTRPAGK
jgi:NAD(P)-dependent dehydrogenase (short-subunit alcohol dehydrogenase family)